MEVLFLILKVIGILLLVLLGIFLFLILSVLFIPVRYRIRAKGAYPGRIEQDAVFSWFFHLIHCRIRYGDNGVQFKLRIFGIPIRFGKEKKKSYKDAYVKEESPEEPNILKEQSSSEKIDVSKEQNILVETDVSRGQSIFEKADVSEKQPASDAHSRTVKQGRKGKITLKQKIQNWKQKWRSIKEKADNIKEQFRNIKNILFEETNKNAVSVLFREFRYLMKHYTPRKASGELQFGMEDPANTGQVLGIISLFPFWYRYKISVVPDFMAESLYIRGEIFIKGHMRSLRLFLSGIRLIKDKNIRKLINQITAK